MSHPTFPRIVLLPPTVIALAALAAACSGSSAPDSATPTPAAATSTSTPIVLSELIDVVFDGLVIRAEPARTGEERAQGLSGHAPLSNDGGMLFFLGEERVPAFTMRGMLFPLDFVWISSDLHVVDLTENVPHPAAPGEALSGIRPVAPVLYVLEVSAGVIAEFGIEVGDEVRFASSP